MGSSFFVSVKFYSLNKKFNWEVSKQEIPIGKSLSRKRFLSAEEALEQALSHLDLEGEWLLEEGALDSDMGLDSWFILSRKNQTYDFRKRIFRNPTPEEENHWKSGNLSIVDLEYWLHIQRLSPVHRLNWSSIPFSPGINHFSKKEEKR